MANITASGKKRNNKKEQMIREQALRGKAIAVVVDSAVAIKPEIKAEETAE